MILVEVLPDLPGGDHPLGVYTDVAMPISSQQRPTFQVALGGEGLVHKNLTHSPIFYKNLPNSSNLLIPLSGFPDEQKSLAVKKRENLH